MMRKILSVIGLIALCPASPSSTDAQQGGNAPQNLLRRALDTAKTLRDRSGFGSWLKPLIVFRVGDGMRLFGMKEEALSAFELSADLMQHEEVQVIKDEFEVELARVMTLCGAGEKALKRITQLKQRCLGVLVAASIARAARMLGDESLLERATREALKLAAQEHSGQYRDCSLRMKFRCSILTLESLWLNS